MVCKFLAITRNDNKFHVRSIVQRRELPSVFVRKPRTRNKTIPQSVFKNSIHTVQQLFLTTYRVPHPPATARNTGRKSLQSLDTAIRVYKGPIQIWNKQPPQTRERILRPPIDDRIKFFVSKSFGSYDLRCNICSLKNQVKTLKLL